MTTDLTNTVHSVMNHWTSFTISGEHSKLLPQRTSKRDRWQEEKNGWHIEETGILWRGVYWNRDDRRWSNKTDSNPREGKTGSLKVRTVWINIYYFKLGKHFFLNRITKIKTPLINFINDTTILCINYFRSQFMKEIRLLKEKVKVEPTAEANQLEINRHAALMIQKLWRGYVTRRNVRKRVLDEMLLIGS